MGSRCNQNDHYILTEGGDFLSNIFSRLFGLYQKTRYSLEKVSKLDGSTREVASTLRTGQEVKQLSFKNFLYKILVIWANFGDFGDFDIDFKILKKSCKDCSPIFWPILENFGFRIWMKSQSYDKPPWRNLFFVKIWIFSWKSKISNP